MIRIRDLNFFFVGKKIEEKENGIQGKFIKVGILGIENEKNKNKKTRNRIVIGMENKQRTGNRVRVNL